MAQLKIKIPQSTDTGVKYIWEPIDELKLTNASIDSLKANNISLGDESLNQVIEDSAVSVYIHVNTKTNANGAYTQIGDDAGTEYASLTAWFEAKYPKNGKEYNKAIKGFLIEHRTQPNGTFHLPHYWNGTAWTPLNAIWG